MEKVIRKSLLCFVLTLFASFSFAQGSNIVGTVLYNGTFPMDDVDAYLLDSSGSLIASTTTNAAGVYEFSNVPDGIYTITFSTDEPAGGVTLTDAFLVMLHILNFYPFTPFQEMVADVNNSGSVTWSDYFEILISYLNQGNPLSGGDWVFEELPVTVEGSNREGFTSNGGSNGDVNGTFIPPKYGNCFVHNTTESISIKPNESNVLHLEADQGIEISGMHLVFQVPEELEVISVSSYLADLHLSQSGKEVRITWMSNDASAVEISPDEPFLGFTVSTGINTHQGGVLNLELTSESHLIGKTGDMLPFVNLSLPGVIIEGETAIMVNETIYPNPFLAYTTLEYVLPSDGKVKIIVTNSAGQIVQLVTDEFQDAGSYRVKIDGSDWPSGVYQYGIYFSGTKTVVKAGSMIKSK